MTYLDTNFAGKFAESETKNGGKRLYDKDVDGSVMERHDSLRLDQTTSSGYVQQGLFAGFQHFGDVDLVLAETRLEQHENVVDFADGEILDDQHGSEEDQHLPHADEDVREITGRLHFFLDLTQIFHKACISFKESISCNLNLLVFLLLIYFIVHFISY